MTPLSATSSATAAPTGERAKLAIAAKQFEAIFIRQMLSAARATDFGGGLFDSEALGTFRQMQDERFAEIASQTGAFGIAKQIEAQLSAQLGVANGSAPPAAADKAA